MTDDAQPDDFVDTGAGEEALEQLRAENAQLKDQALRYAAEAENTRRRAEREVNDARAFAIQRFARDLLGVADNLSRALEHAPQREGAEPTVGNFVLGVELTERELSGAFERNGLKKVAPAAGDRFDPNLHQAMTEQVAEGVAPGAVVQTLQTGYELFGRIVRPALVVVAPRAAAGQAAEPAPAADPYAAPPADESGRAYDGRA